MKPITACLLALSTLTLLGQSRSAHAQATFFPNDATINYAIAGEADIGEDDDGNQSDSNNNPYNPTVSLVTGGSISGVTNVWNGSVFNMSGGSTGTDANFDSVFTYGTSTANISGGTIAGGVYAATSSVVNFSGGDILASSSVQAEGLYADINSTINITGGTNAVGLNAAAQGTFNIRGGALLPGAQLYAQDSSTLNFFGNNLKARLTSTLGGVDTYTLSGTLTDGSDLAGIQMIIAGSATYTFNGGLGLPPPVPEPGSLALLCGLGVMGAGLLCRQRRR